MQPEKKQLEIVLIDYFRRSYTDFPKGRVVSSESPDFWVRMKSKNVIGIELTRLNPANAIPPDDQRTQEILFRDKLILNAKEIFERNSEIKLLIKVLFSDTEKIGSERAMSVSVRLAGLIRNAIVTNKRDVFKRVLLSKDALPDGLEEVLVIQHPKLKTAIWERSNNLGISNDVVDDIWQAIRKKDEKLRLYQKNHLNYYWLLITTDFLRGVKSFNLHNKIMNHRFESRFQHVFLFDLIKAKVFELV